MIDVHIFCGKATLSAHREELEELLKKANLVVEVESESPCG